MAAIGGLLIASVVGRPLDAQRGSVVEIGVSVVRLPADSATSIGPSAQLVRSWQHSALFASGAASGYGTTEGAAAGVALNGGARSALARIWLGELAGELGAVFGTSSGSAQSAILSARTARPFAGGGVWLRASGNLGKRESGALWGRGIDVGSWWRWHRAQLSASLQREWTAGQLFLGPGRRQVVGEVPVRYAEGAVGLRVNSDAASFALDLALRRDPDAERLYEPGVNATAVFQQTPTRAVVFTVARQLPDFVRGGDPLQYVSVGLRFRSARDARPPASSRRPTIHVSGDSAMRLLRVRAPGAKRVEIMGDFTGWEPLELEPDGEGFARAVTLRAGTHRVVVRIDSGAWTPAANTPAVDDDLGGRAGMLVVPD